MKPISTAEFARAVGISRQAAHRAFQNAAQGQKWKGYLLPVVNLPGNRGGASGRAWGLAVDRCPADLKAKLGVFKGPFEAPIQGALNGKIEPWQWEEQADRLRIIAPVIGLEKRAPERAEAFRRIAAERHVVRGVPTRLAENTIRDWVRVYELQGPAGLIPALRGDKGKARVPFTREWDTGIDLPIDRRTALRARVTTIARSLVAEDGTSIRETLRLCSDHLCRLSTEAGSQLPVPVLRGLCQLNVKWAERIDLERYRLSYLARKDHKRHQDKTVGRASLALADRPMSLVQGATATGCVGVGRAEKTVDNSAGANGALSVEYRIGIFLLANSAAGDLITIADIGKVCYIVDDQTVAKTDGTATRSRAGIVDGIEPTGGVWVRCDEALARAA